MIWFTIGWCVKFALYWIRRGLGFKPAARNLVTICVVCRDARRTVGARLSVTCRRTNDHQRSDILYNETYAIVNAERSGDPIWPVDIRVFTPTECADAEIHCVIPELRKEAELKISNVHAGWNDYTLFLKDKPDD